MNNSLFDQIASNTFAIKSMIAKLRLPLHDDEDCESAATELGVIFELFESSMSQYQRAHFESLSLLGRVLKYFDAVGYPPSLADGSTVFRGFDHAAMILSFAMYRNRIAHWIFLQQLPNDSSCEEICQAMAAEATALIVIFRDGHGQGLRTNVSRLH